MCDSARAVEDVPPRCGGHSRLTLIGRSVDHKVATGASPWQAAE
jgi:hypothetical protein